MEPIPDKGYAFWRHFIPRELARIWRMSDPTLDILCADLANEFMAVVKDPGQGGNQ